MARFQEAEGVGVGRDGYWGWHGYGGSVFQWDPELRIGWDIYNIYIVCSIYNILISRFAYTPTLLHWFDMQNNRGRQLQQEVRRCVLDMNKS